MRNTPYTQPSTIAYKGNWGTASSSLNPVKMHYSCNLLHHKFVRLNSEFQCRIKRKLSDDNTMQKLMTPDMIQDQYCY